MIAPCLAKVDINKEDIYLEAVDMDVDLSLDIDLVNNVLTIMHGSKFKSVKMKDEEIIKLGDVVTEIVKKYCELAMREGSAAIYACVCGFGEKLIKSLRPFLEEIEARARLSSAISVPSA